MRVLFDITHPVNVHFFKHLIAALGEDGHDVLVTARDKDVSIALLDSLGITYQCISRQRSGLWGMARELGERNVRLFRLARRFGPDVMVAAEAGVSIGPVGAAIGVPRVVFDQVDRAPLQRALGMPFATYICTGDGYLKDHGARHVRFRGFLAQAYLDPRRFEPDAKLLRRAGVDPDEPYIVLRLVGWSATHDIGRRGLSEQELSLLVDRLSAFGRVMISSETPLPDRLRAHEIPVPMTHFHDLLALATLCIAEGGTVGVEAGLLGTPAICCNTYDFGYLRAMEKRYRLIRRVWSLREVAELAEDMLHRDDLRADWQRRRASLFAETDDVLAFMRSVVELAASQHRGRVAGRGHSGRR